jgi:hypothetical protein
MRISYLVSNCEQSGLPSTPEWGPPNVMTLSILGKRGPKQSIDKRPPVRYRLVLYDLIEVIIAKLRVYSDIDTKYGFRMTSM